MSSNEFLKKTVLSVQEAYPNLVDSALLTNLLPSILVSLIARETNIIVCTSQQYEVQKAVSKILSTIFGMHCKRVKIRGQQAPTQFLSSLFVSTSSSASSSSSHKRRSSKASLGRSLSAPRPPSSHFTEQSDSTIPRALPRHKTDPLRYDQDTVPTLELPNVVIISNLEKVGRPASLALAEALRTRRITLESGVWDLPDGFFIVYISPPSDGYERPSIHLNLLDHFAFSITVTPTSPHLTPASSSPIIRPIPIPSTIQKPPMFPYTELPTTEDIYISPVAANYKTALVTAIRHHPELDGMFLTARCLTYIDRLLRASAIVFGEGDGRFISEAHIRRVIPPVLIHRLRVRDGPREQLLGLVWEEAGIKNWGNEEPNSKKDRRSAKAILADILTEV